MDQIELLLLIMFSFLPPIIFAIWIRNTEKYNREKWYPIFLCFLWGATIAIIAAIVLEVILEIPLALSIKDYNTTGFLMIVVIAPFAEEYSKPLALRLRKVERELDELEDGLIYGAVAGLGFSATENLLYGWSFLQEGMLYFIILISIRSFGGCLLHAAATAWTGYGIGKRIMKKTSFIRVIPYFLLACFVHGLYNFLVTFELNGVVIGFFAAMIFVALSIHLVRKKIKTLDLQSA